MDRYFANRKFISLVLLYDKMKSVIYLMEWLSNVTNQMDSFGLMANDIGLDSCHLEAVDESHNGNRDWSGAIKD